MQGSLEPVAEMGGDLERPRSLSQPVHHGDEKDLLR